MLSCATVSTIFHRCAYLKRICLTLLFGDGLHSRAVIRQKYHNRRNVIGTMNTLTVGLGHVSFVIPTILCRTSLQTGHALNLQTLKLSPAKMVRPQPQKSCAPPLERHCNFDKCLPPTLKFGGTLSVPLPYSKQIT